jgi:hypothetical protein
MRRRIAALAALLLASASAFAQTSFHFATAAETRKLLAADDDWLTSLGEFNRAAIAGRAISAAGFKAAVQKAATECAPSDIERWRPALARVASRYEELRLRLPATVTIACTDGTDAGGAPYTRGDAVFIPKNVGNAGESLFAHELFHIFSRNRRAASSRLYSVIGFSEAPPLQWPAEWVEARITNPDAPFDRHTMRIEVQGTKYDVMPVLVARRTTLQPGETFFNVLDVRLLAVERSADGKASVPLRRDGQPVWFDANTTEPYLRQLGGNTGYIIHPEETTADNVTLLVTRRTPRNPAIVDGMRDLLANPKVNP